MQICLLGFWQGSECKNTSNSHGGGAGESDIMGPETETHVTTKSALQRYYQASQSAGARKPDKDLTSRVLLFKASPQHSNGASIIGFHKQPYLPGQPSPPSHPSNFIPGRFPLEPLWVCIPSEIPLITVILQIWLGLTGSRGGRTLFLAFQDMGSALLEPQGGHLGWL